MKIKGRNAVREALNSNVNILKIMASNSSKDKVLGDILNLAKQKNIKIQYLDNKILDRECENNQGIIAETSEFKYSSVEDILAVAKEKNKNNFILHFIANNFLNTGILNDTTIANTHHKTLHASSKKLFMGMLGII